MNKMLLGCGLGVSALVAAGCGQTEEKKLPAKPNVIFLVADDLGIGDLSCYGMHRIQTPNVDSLASSGLRFIDAHSTASTSTPSRYSLFTGCYNWRRNDTGIAPGDAAMIIRPEQITVADMFKEAGYTTGAIGKWHLGMGDKRGEQDWNGVVTPGPKDLGFDYSCLMAATADRVPCVWIENGRVENYDPTAPIEVNYKAPIPGEPTGKNNPELLYNMKLDNADLRLTEKGYKIGLATEERYNKYLQKKENVEKELKRLQETEVYPKEVEEFLVKYNSTP